MTKQTQEIAAREGYDRWAAVYDSDDNPLIALDEQVVPRLLGNLAGLRVLELACGTGRHTLRLAAGAAELTAVDFSCGMLEQARRRLQGQEVRFLEADLRQALAFDDGAFDRVVCCLALEHLPELAPLFREVHRVLAPGGQFVCSDMHHAMRLRGKQASFDVADGTKLRLEGYAHPITSYVTAALSAGFGIDQLEEHCGGPELTALAPGAGKYEGFPMLFAMRVVK